MKVYRKCKIYFDGSHYIALPYRHDPDKEVEDIFAYDKVAPIEFGKRVNMSDIIDVSDEVKKLDKAKRIFEDNYKEAMSLTKSQRFDFYYNLLKDIFPERKKCDRYVQDNLNRKFRNFIYRKLRMLRKVNLLKFDYFCTFTYDSEKMNEDDFRKKLKYFLRHRATRNGWKYIGVFERSPEKKRLHFHCLLNAEDNTIPGTFIKKRVWSSKVKKMKIVFENDYIKKRFGVNDFSPIDYEDGEEYMSCINYLLKYIEKSGEKILYSRGLYQYLVSNVDIEEDVVTTHYDLCVKHLLFDDFCAFNDNGTLIGVCSEEVLSKLKRTNE